MLKKYFNKIKKLLKEKDFANLYRHLVMALLLNVPVIYLILWLDVKQADFTLLSWFYISCVIVGYYVLPLLVITTALFVLFFQFKRLLYLSVGALPRATQPLGHGQRGGGYNLG